MIVKELLDNLFKCDPYSQVLQATYPESKTLNKIMGIEKKDEKVILFLKSSPNSLKGNHNV